MTRREWLWFGSALSFFLMGGMGIFFHEMDDVGLSPDSRASMSLPEKKPVLQIPDEPDQSSSFSDSNLFGFENSGGSDSNRQPPENTILGRYRLSGVLLSGQKKLVLLQSVSDGQVTRLFEGDTIDHWRLARIGEGRLVFTREGENKVYEIGDVR